jgi:putative ABC transport system permease protein
MLPELIVEALRNLMRHKLRSLLTALGIIFGIASVVSMVSAGEGARRAILAQIRELGTNNIIVNAIKPPAESDGKKAEEQDYILRYGLTFRDLEQIRRTLPYVTSALPVHDVKDWIWFRSRRVEARIRGVTPEYFDRLHLEPMLGRTLTPGDEGELSRVCVVRMRVLREAQYLGDPMKLDLKIGSQFYRVVGVLPDHGDNPDRSALGLDDRALEVYVPFETVVDRLGLTHYRSESGGGEYTRVELHQIVCTIDDEENVPAAARGLQAILSKFHPRRDYEVVVPIELLKQRAATQRTFDIVLPVIAGISLLVGGIGIMNIMLASVTERTREIGIRRAIGASRFDITLQFLIETVTLALIGGLLGVLLGVVGAKLLEQATEWKPVITASAVLLSLGISCVTGIVFGIYPAHRAASMNPVQALRHE